MFLEPNQVNHCKRFTYILRKLVWRESHLGVLPHRGPRDIPTHHSFPRPSAVARSSSTHTSPHFTRSFFNKTTQLTTPLLSTGRIPGYAQSATRLCAPGSALHVLASQQTTLPLSQTIP